EDGIRDRNVTGVQTCALPIVRKLRSGRSLLLIKATDYTDSLEIKMFSRNDEDAAMFDAVKAGIWIKARGRIQTDMYSNELTMIGSEERRVGKECRGQ